VVDLPSPEWLFGEKIPEKDWATAWITTYNNWVYITAWREPDILKGTFVQIQCRNEGV